MNEKIAKFNQEAALREEKNKKSDGAGQEEYSLELQKPPTHQAGKESMNECLQ